MDLTVFVFLVFAVRLLVHHLGIMVNSLTFPTGDFKFAMYCSSLAVDLLVEHMHCVIVTPALHIYFVFRMYLSSSTLVVVLFWCEIGFHNHIHVFYLILINSLLILIVYFEIMVHPSSTQYILKGFQADEMSAKLCHLRDPCTFICIYILSGITNLNNRPVILDGTIVRRAQQSVSDPFSRNSILCLL